MIIKVVKVAIEFCHTNGSTHMQNRQRLDFYSN